MSAPRGIPKHVRLIVEKRAEMNPDTKVGKCERCGQWRRLELHHRRFRSRQGKHVPSNLVALCGMGNTDGCHGIAHSPIGDRGGWAVSAWGTPPVDVPIQHAVWGLVWLTDRGTFINAEQRGAQA